MPRKPFTRKSLGRARVAAQSPTTAEGLARLGVVSEPPAALPAIGAARSPREGMNKLEAAYADHLDALRLAGAVRKWWYEPFGLRLAQKTHYHPDFLVQLASGHLEAHETKGGLFRDDARVKVKVAAREHDWLPIVVVRRVKGGGWEFERIKGG